MNSARIVRDMMNYISRRVSENGSELRNQDIWREVRRLGLTRHFINLEDCEIFKTALELAPLFVKADCRDRGLIAEVLHFARKARVPRYLQFIPNFMSGRLYGTIRRNYTHIRAYMDENDDFIKIFFMPYNEVQVYDPFGDSVMDSAVAGDNALLKLLLKFGATIIQLPDNRWAYFVKVIRRLFSSIHDEDIRASLVSNFIQISERRLFFVILCLEVLIHLKSHRWDSCIASLRLLFKAIPEPLVTGKEISNCLKKLLREFQKDEEIQTLVNEFGKFFPESLQTPGPRTLKHLSRFQIRENLRTSNSAFRLPQAIDSLPLPEKLKEYVLLTDTDTF